MAFINKITCAARGILFTYFLVILFENRVLGGYVTDASLLKKTKKQSMPGRSSSLDPKRPSYWIICSATVYTKLCLMLVVDMLKKINLASRWLYCTARFTTNYKLVLLINNRLSTYDVTEETPFNSLNSKLCRTF